MNLDKVLEGEGRKRDGQSVHANISARFLHGEEGLLLRQLVWDKGAGRQRASRARFFTLPAFPPFSSNPFSLKITLEGIEIEGRR